MQPIEILFRLKYSKAFSNSIPSAAPEIPTNVEGGGASMVS